MKTTTATITDVAESALFTEKLAHLVRSWPGTQKALATKVGIRQQMMSQYMRGVIPKPHLIRKLALELGIIDNLPWLLDEGDDRLEPPEQTTTTIQNAMADATPQDLLEHLVRGYLSLAIPLRKRLDELVGQGGIDWVAIWLLSNVLNKEVPDPIRDMAAILKSVSVMSDGLYMYDFNTALDDEVRRRKLDVTAYELGLKCLIGDWDELRKNNPGIDALLEYLNVVGTTEIGLPRIPLDPKPSRRKDREAWTKTRAPYLLARLVTHENNEYNPKVATIVKALKNYGYLDKQGNPTEPEGLDEGFPLDEYFAEEVPEHLDGIDEEDDET